ncbi:MAG: hypothetical protein AB1546_05865 [bacterium]
MNNKYEHLIVRRPVAVSSLPHHENMPGVQYPVLMSKSLVAEADVWVGFLFASKVPEILAENIQHFGRAVRHKHSAPEIYIFIGDEEAITAEITLGDEKYEVSSPCCVYIPAGLPHDIRPIRAVAGKAAGFIPVVLAGEYNTEDA